MPMRHGGRLAAVLPSGHATTSGATPILAHDVERILPDVDADHDDSGIEI
jgi:hypothetical protein